MAAVASSPPARSARPLRLAILDDNPFVRAADGTVHPRAATFHRFAEAVVRVGPFQPARYMVPVRDLGVDDPPPALPAIDALRLSVVPTAPFDGAAGYLRAAPLYYRRNRPIVQAAVSGSDLVWIKAPASNALLTARASRRAGVPRFTYIAGSARSVVGAQARTGIGGVAAGAAAALYDGVTDWLARSGPTLSIDGELFTSVLDPDEIARTPAAVPAKRPDEPWRIVWAGRLAGEKGVPDMLAAVAGLRGRGRDISVLMIGDGPAAGTLREDAARYGLAHHVEWAGYIGEPSEYMALMRTGDLFVLPSRAEGVPKVLVEAMAAGLPVVATRSGRTADVCGDGARGLLVEPGDIEGLDRAIALSMDDPRGRLARRTRALAWAGDHTAEAQALRLVHWLRGSFPQLPWPRLP